MYSLEDYPSLQLIHQQIRNAHSQHNSAKAWKLIHKLSDKINHVVKTYTAAQNALWHLGHVDSNYPPITKADLKMPGDIVEANQIGQRSDKMAWFWRLGSFHEKEDTPQMKECMYLFHCYKSLINLMTTVYQVNWLQASARFNRWDEEVDLLQKEMTWTTAFFANRQSKWRNILRSMEERMVTDSSLTCRGLKSYAHKQIHIWSQFECMAQKSFTALEKM